MSSQSAEKFITPSCLITSVVLTEGCQNPLTPGFIKPFHNQLDHKKCVDVKLKTGSFLSVSDILEVYDFFTQRQWYVSVMTKWGHSCHLHEWNINIYKFSNLGDIWAQTVGSPKLQKHTPLLNLVVYNHTGTVVSVLFPNQDWNISLGDFRRHPDTIV